jgi:hypothetical protein
LKIGPRMETQIPFRTGKIMDLPSVPSTGFPPSHRRFVSHARILAAM